ncbi:glycosyltransferase family 2 protein [Ponticoccus sp. SC2-23]|nr:glycosyltransferase family 2 protein [Ponticoccus sp. SC6-9]MBM1227013.1 glycosyltransferase family 2 protein [Ponticoccus sp. SC6-15]MBM1231434.1 glycosyltransferase family 2 protein [Ponticoccus sp. SC6-38]MBM1236007.1 glycosyltransferase family 2 protein [Ponticoccus sp. SC6-45]MBM1240457.1 glycosyltransferase family 2 protein [Ponticoccus sp. SC6-49]MBM1244992.1 glycosyltransferase family 2 protein [Ponticoccus sp. SC2-64]MBM1249481.1 glycosyltransferase family 2 protein [Ponticoccus s
MPVDVSTDQLARRLAAKNREAPELSVIIVSFNTSEMTLACIESVYAQTTVPFEVIVVDNASTDGSARAIGEAFPQVHLIAEQTNHGFARAHDVAVPHASAPWLLLLNPDTVVLDSALDNLLAFAKTTPAAGIWGGRTLYPDGTLNPYSCWGRMTLWSVLSRTLGMSGIFARSEVFNSEVMGGWKRDTEREVDIVTGCLFLIRRDMWDRLGGFDPDFTMYGEEADLCLRGKAIGLRPRITPHATIIHYGGASERVRADKMVRLLRAKVELIKRHFAPGTRTVGYHIFRIWPLSRRIIYTLAYKLRGRPSDKQKARDWGEIWTRRNEWQSGFPAR